MENIISIEHLNYKNIFHDFSMKIEKNKFITISGANNCGKTTLLRMIDGRTSVYDCIKLENQYIEEYKLTELGQMIGTIIPEEIFFTTETVEKEIEKSKVSKAKIEKRLNKKLLSKNPNELEEKDKIKLKLFIELEKKNKILLIDDIFSYVEEEKEEIIDLIKKKSSKKTIIVATLDMNIALKSDYIYIIDQSKIILEGAPIEVLTKDNILNKNGLELPFLMDLSVKLMYYDLIDKVMLEEEEIIRSLWN